MSGRFVTYHRRVHLRSLAACVALTSLTCLSACGDNGASAQGHPAGEPKAAAEVTELVSATSRGLAAGLLAHLSGAEVTYVGGSEDVGALSVMVATDDPDIETVHLYVHEKPGIGALPCGTDFGYQSNVCDVAQGSTTELLVRKNGNEDMPDLMGRYFDASRKNVLVQVWGSKGSEAESLIRDLLNDPLLGAVTSDALNEEGEQLSEFEQLKSEAVVSTD